MKRWLETEQVLGRLDALARSGRRAALATVVRVRGSAYRREGAKLLVADDESTIGNVSGGCLELDVREVARLVIGSGRARLRKYCSGADAVEAWDLGLGCEGQVEIFVEPVFEPRVAESARLRDRAPFAVCTVIDGPAALVGRRMTVTGAEVVGGLGASELDARVAARSRELLGEGGPVLEEFGELAVFLDVLTPPPSLLLCGAGDDARPLADLAATVGFQVTVADRRSGFLVPERFPSAVERIDGDARNLLDRVGPDGADFAVVMSHSFADDLAYLRCLLATPVRFIGVLGPRARTDRILDRLGRERRLSEIDLGRIYAPVGLDIGGEGGEQVAVAVIAELLAVRAGRHPRSLRERYTPIHASDRV